jgi:ATP-dependent DNA helicase PIF1
VIAKLPTVGTYVTASTGIAAVALGGTTLHAFAGVGLGNQDADVLTGRILRSATARLRWCGCKVLLIDEVSMVDSDFFDKLEEVARNVRRSVKPWGGIQLILTGDFLQLPPVSRGAKFAFLASSWASSVPRVVDLTEVFRQASDIKFASVLGKIRLGNYDEECKNALAPCSRRVFDRSDGIEPTVLHATRGDVNTENTARLSELRGEACVFTADDTGITIIHTGFTVPMLV